MNVIISNKYTAMLQSLNIDIIKSLNGEFTVEDIVSQFQNFYFQRMILDITAVKDYKDIRNLQKLSISLDMEKVILLLDDSSESSSTMYLSRLISMGIYNFTKNLEGIMYLYNNPNTYRDVAQYHKIDDFTQPEAPVMAAVPISTYDSSRGVRIIGVKNVTRQAGSTTLVYMMRNQLLQQYNVIAIEVGKTDFAYFKDPKLVSTIDAEVGVILNKHNDKDIILMDINESPSALAACHDIVYLIEPSTIKLNRLLMVEPRTLGLMQQKKVMLNKSMLTSKDVMDFEYESKLKIFFNMPSLDERIKDIPVMNEFLSKLGFSRMTSSDGEKRGKGVFK